MQGCVPLIPILRTVGEDAGTCGQRWDYRIEDREIERNGEGKNEAKSPTLILVADHRDDAINARNGSLGIVNMAKTTAAPNRVKGVFDVLSGVAPAPPLVVPPSQHASPLDCDARAPAIEV